MEESRRTMEIACNAKEFKRQGSLRCSISPGRSWWDLSDYHLDTIIDIEKQTVQGSNTKKINVLKLNQVKQINLQPAMAISKVTQEGK